MMVCAQFICSRTTIMCARIICSRAADGPTCLCGPDIPCRNCFMDDGPAVCHSCLEASWQAAQHWEQACVIMGSSQSFPVCKRGN